MSKVYVVVPTMGRPEQLDRAVRSLFNSENAGTVEKLVIVDNHPQATALSVANCLKHEAEFSVIYVHEPRPGVANARNAGVTQCADADFIAFLDDDEVASPQWLNALVSTALMYDADVVFGPIDGYASCAPVETRPLVEAFFSRSGPKETQLIDRAYGCGNSLLKAKCLIDGVPFDPATNETGGEDDTLFARLIAKGAVIAWSADAAVEEHVPKHRATMRYLLVRAFARGQGPSQTSAENRHWLGLIGWSLVGAAQVCVYGVSALATRFASPHTSARLAIRCAEGLGKMFWFSSFEPKLYGQSELKAQPAGSSDQAT